MRTHVNAVLLPTVLLLLIGGVGSEAREEAHTNTDDQCFCELSGQVDDCDCKIEAVFTFNNIHIKPRLNSLLERDYFKFYKVNLDKPCPFWPDDGSCAFESCAVCPCPEDEIQWVCRKFSGESEKEEVPCGLKEEHEEEPGEKYTAEKNEADEEACLDSGSSDRHLGALDTTISKKDQAALETWQEHDDAQMDFCEPQDKDPSNLQYLDLTFNPERPVYITDEDPSSMQYVDLTINPERYTGYKGASPRRIWNSIYKENCFKPEQEITGYGSLASDRFVKSMCLEKRAFYRLISGLHSSINIHLSAKYLLNEGKLGPQVWGHNVEEFKHRFHPKFTRGEGPIRLKNLFFTYLIVLRAIDKAAPILENEKYYSGRSDEDDDVRLAVKSLLKMIKTFPNHFNESAMFQGDSAQSHLLMEEFKSHFRNISKIMDCVGCDKCRLWGKLQTQGLGTALKILFAPPTRRKPLRLKRQEIVALINGLGRLSSSVRHLEEFRSMIEAESNGHKPPIQNKFF